MIKNILKLKYIVVILSVLMIIGCTTTVTDTPVETQPEPTIPTEDGVTRVISSNNINVGDTVTIKLYINMNQGQSYYAVEEEVPVEFEVLDKETDDNNKLKLIKIKNVVSSVYEYNVKPSQAGTFTFSGVYASDYTGDPVDIMGDNTITVN